MIRIELDVMLARRKMTLTELSRRLDQKRKANGPHRVVDVDNDAPDGATLKLFRALGDELPDLGQVLVPGVEGILQILNNPVIGHSTTSFPATVRGRPPWACPHTAVIRISR